MTGGLVRIKVMRLPVLTQLIAPLKSNVNNMHLIFRTFRPCRNVACRQGGFVSQLCLLPLQDHEHIVHIQVI